MHLQASPSFPTADTLMAYGGYNPEQLARLCACMTVDTGTGMDNEKPSILGVARDRCRL